MRTHNQSAIHGVINAAYRRDRGTTEYRSSQDRRADAIKAHKTYIGVGHHKYLGRCWIVKADHDILTYVSIMTGRRGTAPKRLFSLLSI